MSTQNNNSGITDDEIKRAKDYADALDKLKASISGVNSKLPEFSDGLQAGLKALGEKLPDVIDSITKLNAQNKELAASGQKPVSILSQLASSMFSWNSLISVGVTLLATYSGAIISWVSELIKGETRLTALGKVMKDTKIIMEAVNQSRSQGLQNAQPELAHLKLLYNATQNQNLASKERKKALDEIRDLYPDYFKGISNETILNGNATKQYNDLTNAIIAASRARAAEEIMTKNQVRQLGNDDKLTGLAAKLKQYEAQLKIAQKENEDVVSHPVIGGSSFAPGSDSREQAAYSKLSEIQDRRNELKKTVADITTDSKLLDGQNKALIKSVSDYTEKYGIKVITGLKTTESVRQQSLKTGNKDTTDYLSEAEKIRKDSLTRQLKTTFDAYGTEALAENKRYKQEVEGLNTLFDKKHISAEEYNKVNLQLESEHRNNLSQIIEKYNREDKVKAEQAQQELIALQNKGMAEGAEKQKNILIQQKNENLQLIQKSDDEIISQQQKLKIQMALAVAAGYQNDIVDLKKQLEAKENLLTINKDKRVEIEKQTQVELAKIDAESVKNEKLKKDQQAINQDQANVDGADSPSAKLAAEKQLIWDKAQYEIDTAEGNSVKIKEIETKRNKDIAALDKQNQKQRAEQAIQITQQVASAAFSLISNSIKSASEAKIKGLENDKARELSNTNLTKTQKTAIEAKYKKKENDEKIKAFKAEQKIQIAQAVINGAIAITKTLATTGMPFAIPLIAADVAMTAIQIATIASQKPPQFARGGRFVSDGRGALLPGYSRTDNTNAYLRSGEAVVVSEAMRNPWARNLVSAINVAHGGRDFSMRNPGNGYAIGGIYTDGGNTNRYYNQPVNDVKELANTIAYQMINNFPPIYVDVKDVNNQQNILAQTVDRVNL
ncbi:hypothetical protein [Mucilaginibacter dorajii]|uniref:Uncharacterized protein n=1 Tax=Mucilaginibacter dorajii TaxID=692994 RepID=A0ABP7R9W3_9SPHI|nr:hypothetical protein [Mucilaginibacter dorajii]MCS3736749.1 hypothetical protein [Mucilaginibacter dorajii]